MTNIRLSRGLCTVVGDLISLTGTHPTLDALFRSAGVPGDPPNLAHHSKWKEWLFRAGQDPDTDSLTVLGNVLEESMDIPPSNTEFLETWKQKRALVVDALQANGLSYFRGGRVLSDGADVGGQSTISAVKDKGIKPTSIAELLKVVVKGLPRAMQPLTHRRKGAISLSFKSEYDIQDLLHSQLRPWIADVRAEEFTPSYAGSSTRMDFLLPEYNLVIETKLVRDKLHGKKLGDELIIDIDHYRAHPDCLVLWCVIYDPDHNLANPSGLVRDLEGSSHNEKGSLETKILIIQP
jgi:hypothetical protein